MACPRYTARIDRLTPTRWIALCASLSIATCQHQPASAFSFSTYLQANRFWPVALQCAPMSTSACSAGSIALPGGYAASNAACAEGASAYARKRNGWSASLMFPVVAPLRQHYGLSEPARDHAGHLGLRRARGRARRPPLRRHLRLQAAAAPRLHERPVGAAPARLVGDALFAERPRRALRAVPQPRRRGAGDERDVR